MRSTIGRETTNQYASQRNVKRGVGGKYSTVGVLDRATGEVYTEAVDETEKSELQGYLEDNVRSDAAVYSDEIRSCEDLPQSHEAVQHSTGKYVRGKVHTNSLESF